MSNKFRASIIHIICIFMAILTFIFMAIPYAGLTYKDKQETSWDNDGNPTKYKTNTISISYNGYEIMNGDNWELLEINYESFAKTVINAEQSEEQNEAYKNNMDFERMDSEEIAEKAEFDAKFAYVFVIIFQIVMIVLISFMILYSAFCIVKNLVGFQISGVPDSLFSGKWARAMLYGHFVIDLLVLIFLIVVTACNVEKGAGDMVALQFRAGLFILLGFTLVALIADKATAGKKAAATFTAGPRVAYVCAQCGANAPAGSKFCPVCGGSVTEKVLGNTVYVCSQCGQPAKKDAKFCEACGGAVVPKVSGVSLFVCSSCGKRVKAGAKFCPDCGGQIVEKRADTVVG